MHVIVNTGVAENGRMRRLTFGAFERSSSASELVPQVCLGRADRLPCGAASMRHGDELERSRAHPGRLFRTSWRR